MKTTIMFQKKSGLLRPAYDQFNELQDSMKELEWSQGVFSKPKKAKTYEQLKYLYGVAYPHLIAWYHDSQGFLYEIITKGETIEVEGNADTADLFFKKLFCISKGITSFKKESSDIEQMIQYIDFLDKLSITNFDCPLPDPKHDKEI